MARYLTSTRFLMTALSVLAVSLAAMSASAAWETPGTPVVTIAAAANVPAPGITATVNDAYFKITPDDVAKAVAEQLQLQAVEQKAEVSLSVGTPPVIHSANHALKVTIHALQIDTQSKRWQAQAYILAGGKTETVKPISGTYMGMVEVPVLTRQLGRTDIIEATDLTTRSVPDRTLRKDTVTDAKMLIGQSPRATISTNRPIRMMEVSSPIVIKKGQPVQLSFTNPYMSLKTSGTALQDGSTGDMIRIKNDKSEKAVNGRVVAAGLVEVNAGPSL